MSEKVYLAIDLGAESGRVIAGMYDGKTIQLQEMHRFPNGPIDVAGTRRWDLIGLWKEILEGLRKSSQKFGERVVSVGVAELQQTIRMSPAQKSCRQMRIRDSIVVLCPLLG